MPPAQDTALPAQKRMALYEEAAEMYRGDYLPKLANQMWVVPISAHYHALYLEAVKEYADLLEHAEKFETMAELCTRASQLDPLDESLHTLIVRALLRQGKDSAALSHYEKATDLLYRNLGVRPSEELRALYREIMDVEERLETNLEVIQANLREAAQRPGAFVCEYGFFKEAYRLEARRSARSRGLRTYRADHRLPARRWSSAPGRAQHHHGPAAGGAGAQPAPGGRGLQVQRRPIRRHAAGGNFEDSTMVVERIVNAFYRQHRRNFLKITYRIRELS